MKCEILATGSKGNCVIIEDVIAIDCGVPFKALKERYRKLQIVLLTHIHSDHFNKATIKRLAKERPVLRFGCGEWLVASLIECGVSKKNIDVYEFGKLYRYQYKYNPNKAGWYAVEPVPLFHNVPNCGYKLTIYTDESGAIGYRVKYREEKLFYATDTNKILAEAKNYDLYLVEANFEDEEVQERIDNQIIEGADYIHEYKAMHNHLSLKDAQDFIAKNQGGNSKYVLLHGHINKED
jgi:phosphoribosyl 1,2-cyclic phosphodiesterase